MKDKNGEVEGEGREKMATREEEEVIFIIFFIFV
jgi:hypothetical protein